ncbi:MAG TPA: hypothetical protein DET40_12540 [Lentisphaeria bacterium]|nr:MAG: hypothetical protein A2X45_00525 [Lentisphaerae bacterium GWF2_50_93]HCE44367.1 hypothetical protein [Lentisphaeria bacterium]
MMKLLILLVATLFTLSVSGGVSVKDENGKTTKTDKKDQKKDQKKEEKKDPGDPVMLKKIEPIIFTKDNVNLAAVLQAVCKQAGYNYVAGVDGVKLSKPDNGRKKDKEDKLWVFFMVIPQDGG